MNSGPKSVVLVFALSEQGRRDAFRKGDSIPIDSRSGGRILQSYSIDEMSGGEIYERAIALDFHLQNDGETAEVPICSSYVYADYEWSLAASKWEEIRHCSSGFGSSYYSNGFGPFESVVPAQPSEPLLLPEVILLPGLVDTDLVGLVDSNPEMLVEYFHGFNFDPTIEELLDHGEAARTDALANAVLVEEASAALAQQYEGYVSIQRDFVLEQFDEWAKSVATTEIPASELRNYRKQLQAISVESSHAELQRVLVYEPQWLVRQLKEARDRLTLQAAVEWSEANGSARLKRIAAEGFLESSMAVYRDERLACERPGWGWIPTAQKVSLRNPVAPGEDEFALLDAAREVSPEAKLHYSTLGKGSGCFVAVDSFLGRQIWFPGDALAELEAAGK